MIPKNKYKHRLNANETIGSLTPAKVYELKQAGAQFGCKKTFTFPMPIDEIGLPVISEKIKINESVVCGLWPICNHYCNFLVARLAPYKKPCDP